MTKVVVRSLLATTAVAGGVGGLVAADMGGSAISVPAESSATTTLPTGSIAGSMAADLDEVTPSFLSSIASFFKDAAADAIGGVGPAYLGYKLGQAASQSAPK